MIERIKELFYEMKLKKEITECLTKYIRGRTDTQAICYKIKIKYSQELDYKLRKFKRLFFKINNENLKVQLVNYYINELIYLKYQNDNFFYDQDEPLNKW